MSGKICLGSCSRVFSRAAKFHHTHSKRTVKFPIVIAAEAGIDKVSGKCSKTYYISAS